MTTMLATDLDRTLFPNGRQSYDGTMPGFCRMVAQKQLPLVYATGRHLGQIREGIGRFGAPEPDFAVAEVGTRLYRRNRDAWEEDTAYRDFIHDQTTYWSTEAFKQDLASLPLRLQPEEHQNPFKLSYFLDDLDRADAIRREAETRLHRVTPDARVIWSIDETEHIGLLDVLPRKANKLEGIEFLRRQMDLPLDAFIYCGDSGNDLLPLTHGYRAVLVANAIEEVRRDVSRQARENRVGHRLYLASGDRYPGLNGNYVSGILEGLIHFGVVSPEEWAAWADSR